MCNGQVSIVWWARPRMGNQLPLQRKHGGLLSETESQEGCSLKLALMKIEGLGEDRGPRWTEGKGGKGLREGNWVVWKGEVRPSVWPKRPSPYICPSSTVSPLRSAAAVQRDHECSAREGTEQGQACAGGDTLQANKVPTGQDHSTVYS